MNKASTWLHRALWPHVLWTTGTSWRCDQSGQRFTRYFILHLSVRHHTVTCAWYGGLRGSVKVKAFGRRLVYER